MSAYLLAVYGGAVGPDDDELVASESDTGAESAGGVVVGGLETAELLRGELWDSQ